MTLLATSVEFGSITGGLAVAWAALSGTSRRLRRMEHRLSVFWREWWGTPASDSLPAQPGVMERLDSQDAHLASQDEHLARQDTQLKDIRAQLSTLRNRTENGGDGG